MKNIALILFLPALIILSVGCNSTKQAADQPATTTTKARSGQRGERGTPEEMFAKMDVNSDGKLSTEEVRGPLKEQFSKIDTDSDGFISMEEMKNAPRPNRQGRPGGDRPNKK